MRVSVGLVTRPMREEDAEGVVAFLSAFDECAVQEWETPDLLRSQIRRNPGCSFVVMEMIGDRESEIVGASVAGTCVLRGVIEHIAIDPGLRGNGIGWRLATRSEEGIRAMGVRRLHVLVTAGNDGAARFWARRGYQTPQGERVMVMGQPPSHQAAGMVFMERDLSDGQPDGSHLAEERFSATRHDGPDDPPDPDPKS